MADAFVSESFCSAPLQLGLSPVTSRLRKFCSATLHVASLFYVHFFCLPKRNEPKKRAPSAEAFLQLPLQNQSVQPKGGPRLPAFLTVVPPYAGRPGGPTFAMLRWTRFRLRRNMVYSILNLNFPFLDFYGSKLRPVLPSKAFCFTESGFIRLAFLIYSWFRKTPFRSVHRYRSQFRFFVPVNSAIAEWSYLLKSKLLTRYAVSH